jgi:hypothetical protein
VSKRDRLQRPNLESKRLLGREEQLIDQKEDTRPPSTRRLSVSLTYGIHDIECDVVGLTVAEAGIAFGDVLNLDPSSQPFLSGRPISDDWILQPGDRLEWMREWGWKGSDTLATTLGRIATSLERIANKLDPPPSDKVGTSYVSDKLGCTTTWVAEMIRKGHIPPSCIVPGSGNGKVWRFYRTRIDAWIESR